MSRQLSLKVELSLVRRYLCGESLYSLARYYRITIEDVINILRRNYVYKDCDYKLDYDTLYVITEMFLAGLTLDKISDLTYIPYDILKHKFIYDSIQEYNYDTRDINLRLLDDYLAGLSIKQLAMKYNMSIAQVVYRLKRFGEYKELAYDRTKRWVARNKLNKRRSTELLKRL